MERATSADEPTVTVFWRPGCFFCHRLLGDLDEIGITPVLRNIWEDPEAAAFVRSVARGHETVPTVTVGETVLVNPRARDVVAASDSEAAA